jgi:hypothetical protein
MLVVHELSTLRNDSGTRSSYKDSLRIVDAAHCSILTERCHRHLYCITCPEMGVQSATRDKRLNIVQTLKLHIGCTAGMI